MIDQERLNLLKTKKEKINSISPSFCAAKWLQTTLYLQNGWNHSCHHPSPHKIPIAEIEADPAALHNSSFKKNMRKKMLEGTRPSECDYCWRIEDLGDEYLSDRHYKTSDYWAWDKVDEIAQLPWDQNVYPTYLEVSFSNVCNFKCSYCSPDVSSKWVEELKQHGPYKLDGISHSLDWLKEQQRFPYRHNEYNPYIEAFWEWFPEAYKHLRVFRITGGEPLLSKDTWKVLDYIKNNPNKHIEIAINSNLCVEDKLIDKLIEYINQLKEYVGNVRLFTSLESVGAKAEYSRYGLDFGKWMLNMDKILSKTDVRITIMTTINVLSLTSTIDFIKLIMDYREKYNKNDISNRIPISFNFLRWPTYLDIRILPYEHRKHLYDQITSFSDEYLNKPEQKIRLYVEEHNQLKRLCDYMISNTDNMDMQKSDFIKFIKQYDQRRFLKFNDVFPEYKYLMD